MRGYIQSFQGKPWNEECLSAYNGFVQLGVDCILFSTNEELDQRKPEDIVVGGLLIMTHVLNQMGIYPENYNYPKELLPYCGRRIWKTKLLDLERAAFPLFIKPLEEKAAKGFVAKSIIDLDEYKHLDPESEVLCSEPVHFLSEWRCFIRYGKSVGLSFYYGDKNYMPDTTVIENAIKDYKDMPAGCSLDFGVTDDGRTLLIEMNDGMALGSYGLPDIAYALLLTARWCELTGTVDAFKDYMYID